MNKEQIIPKVSIIIPTYGRPDKLEKCLLSLNNQTYENFEVVLVDDNGENSENGLKTEAKVNQLKTKIKYSLKYIKLKENKGACFARNEGVKVSSSEFITFLDDDDEYLEDKIEKQIRFILNNDLDLSLCGMYINKNGKFINSYRCYPIGENLKDFVFDGNSITAMIMMKKDIFIKVSGFTDTKKYQDHILMFKILEIKPKLGFLKEKLFIYNIYNGNRISNSKKVIDSIVLRHFYENKWINELNEKDRVFVRFRQISELIIYSKDLNYFKMYLSRKLILGFMDYRCLKFLFKSIVFRFLK